jgi:hypothetical protein
VRNGCPTSMDELHPSEREFVIAMGQLSYGRFESLQIRQGELVLQPWPTSVRSIKFGVTTSNSPHKPSGECELKLQAAQFFGFIRGIDAGEIRVLEVRGGLPFAMEIDE